MCRLLTNLYLLLLFYPALVSTYQYDFAMCAIFQNEAPYLKEWIEFHRLVGTERFYLYNNRSHDHYLEVLQPYVESGFVELVDWPDPDFQMSGQQKAYMDAIDKVRGKVKWLAIIDVDEYIVPKEHNSIPSLLKEFEVEGIGGLGINWQMFGTSFVPRIERNQLLTEELVLKAHENHGENSHIKSIVRPEYVIDPAYIHHFDYKDGYTQVNSNHEPFYGPFSPYIATDKVQINHYWTKDEAFFYETKVPRRQEWGESLEAIEKRLETLNQVKDNSIARFLPMLRQAMFPHKEEDIYHLAMAEEVEKIYPEKRRMIAAKRAGDESGIADGVQKRLAMRRSLQENFDTIADNSDPQGGVRGINASLQEYELPSFSFIVASGILVLISAIAAIRKFHLSPFS